MDLTALSYWFPKIESDGLPVPKTILLEMPDDARKTAWAIFEGEQEPGPGLEPFIAEVATAAASLGYPCFLRTDHTSGKHDWKNTCFVGDVSQVRDRILNVAYFSECCGMFGELPWKKWAVREFLPTMPVGICRGYSDMPICKEFRFFVQDGEVKCRHPYWPLFSLEQGRAEFNPGFDYEDFCSLLPTDEAALTAIAEAAGRVLGGAWSVDLLETERGWFLTDMAEARSSYHWEGCPNDFKRAA